MREIRMVIPGEPRTKKNSSRVVQVRGITRVLPSEAFLEYQERFGWHMPHKGRRIAEPVTVTAIFYMGTRRRVDLVNLLEAVDDILVHFDLLEDDNNRIVCSHDGSRVRYDKENPRTEIIITEFEEE